MPLTAGAADFIRLDGASYDTMWQKGKPSRNTAPWKIPCITAWKCAMAPWAPTKWYW